jgi:excisionase family DNA binding protein
VGKEAIVEDSAYVSRAIAARMLGVSEHTVDDLIQSGRLPVARPGMRARRSLLKVDVRRVARQRRKEASGRAKEQADRERRSLERQDPPGEWLSAKEVAARLGCTPVWVRRLAAQDRLPHVLRPDGVYRFRRDHIELIANAKRVDRLTG